MIVAPLNSQNIESLLEDLEENMSKRDEYDHSKETIINNLKELLKDSTTTSENRFYITDKIIDEF